MSIFEVLANFPRETRYSESVGIQYCDLALTEAGKQLPKSCEFTDGK